MNFIENENNKNIVIENNNTKKQDDDFINYYFLYEDIFKQKFILKNNKIKNNNIYLLNNDIDSFNNLLNNFLVKKNKLFQSLIYDSYKEKIYLIYDSLLNINKINKVMFIFKSYIYIYNIIYEKNKLEIYQGLINIILLSSMIIQQQNKLTNLLKEIFDKKNNDKKINCELIYCYIFFNSIREIYFICLKNFILFFPVTKEIKQFGFNSLINYFEIIHPKSIRFLYFINTISSIIDFYFCKYIYNKIKIGQKIRKIN